MNECQREKESGRNRKKWMKWSIGRVEESEKAIKNTADMRVKQSTHIQMHACRRVGRKHKNHLTAAIFPRWSFNSYCWPLLHGWNLYVNILCLFSIYVLEFLHVTNEIKAFAIFSNFSLSLVFLVFMHVHIHMQCMYSAHISILARPFAVMFCAQRN